MQRGAGGPDHRFTSLILNPQAALYQIMPFLPVGGADTATASYRISGKDHASILEAQFAKEPPWAGPVLDHLRQESAQHLSINQRSWKVIP